ncbi:MAG: phosphatidate cytidylyltransferase [Pseudomonadota bacterium]
MSLALRQRLASAIVLGPLVVAAIVLGEPWSLLLLIFVVVALAWEWTRLTLPQFVLLAFLSLVAGPMAAVILASRDQWALGLLALLVSGLLAMLISRQQQDGQGLWLLLGAFYIGLPALALYWLRDIHPEGLGWTLWLVAIVWAVDVFAYLVGSQVGGPKLWPRLSPRKTWSGFAGGTAAGLGMGLLGGLWLETTALWVLAALAFLLVLVTQAGDLFESAIKRRFGVKDAGSLIPGHGGLLDRVDGLLPASIALAVALWLGVQG